MIALEAWIHGPAGNALGWTLAHSIWEGAAVALILAVILATARSPRVKYAAACGTLAVMLAGFGATFARLHATGPAFRPALQAPIEGSLQPSAFPDWDPQETGAAGFLPWLVPFWAAGVVAFSLRNVAGGMAALRLRSRGVCSVSGAWQERLARLRARLSVSAPVTLLESSLIAVPVVIGHLRPVILVPAGLLAGLPAAQVELILLHELAHIRRMDYLINLLQVFAESLLFYHPAAWWMSSVIRAEREKCCDDVVVSVHRNAHDYARALAALEENRAAALEPALAATGGNLVNRIRRLLDMKEEPRSALAPFLLTVAVAASLMAAQAPPPADTANPYWRWLNQDVVYIIAGEERSAFERLQTDSERERFIEQFWSRRDPDPATAPNEFKEEHYRRIGYANRRFASTIPGWKTDFGRTYIQWGPPDEIETHPSGGTYQRPAEQGGGAVAVYAFEKWRYRHVQGAGNNVILEFVDTSGWGDYRMVTDPSVKYRPATAGPAGATYFSTGPGSRAAVAVTPERAVLIRVPLDFAAKQYFVGGVIRGDKGATAVFERLVAVCEQSQTPGCLPQPVFKFDPLQSKPVEPGNYTFEAVVKDPSTGAQKAYAVKFPVK